MSQKITPKNLSYNTTLPPFLARLRGQGGGSSFDGPDPILAAQRRPTKRRTSAEDEEDAPLVVDESGHAVGGVSVGRDGTVIEREEGDGATAEDTAKGVSGAGDEADGRDRSKDTEKVASIGAGKKRKVGRVVGGDAEEGTTAEGDSRPSKEKAKKGQSGEENGGGKVSIAPKSKKKVKKIKLSFGDDEG